MTPLLELVWSKRPDLDPLIEVKAAHLFGTPRVNLIADAKCVACGSQLVDLPGDLAFQKRCPECECGCRYRKESLLWGGHGLYWPCGQEHLDAAEAKVTSWK